MGVKFIHAAYGFGEIEDEVPWIEKPLELKRSYTKNLVIVIRQKSPYIRNRNLVYGDFFF